MPRQIFRVPVSLVHGGDAVGGRAGVHGRCVTLALLQGADAAMAVARLTEADGS